MYVKSKMMVLHKNISNLSTLLVDHRPKRPGVRFLSIIAVKSTPNIAAQKPLEFFATVTFAIRAEKLSIVIRNECRLIDGKIVRASPSIEEGLRANHISSWFASSSFVYLIFTLWRLWCH